MVATAAVLAGWALAAVACAGADRAARPENDASSRAREDSSPSTPLPRDAVGTTPAVLGVPDPPDGLRLDSVASGAAGGPAAGPSWEGRTRPEEVLTVVYRVEAGDDTSATPDAAPAITLTLAIMPEPAGALAAYNAWFAAAGFMAAAERTPVDIGEQAQRFDVGWPPLHALVARAGRRFVLVEAADAVPADKRPEWQTALARAALEAAWAPP